MNLLEFFNSLWPLLLVAALYFLPTLFAIFRFHKAKNSIAIINLFLGWTLIGWVICLAWSAGSNVEPKEKRLYINEIKYDA